MHVDGAPPDRCTGRDHGYTHRHIRQQPASARWYLLLLLLGLLTACGYDAMPDNTSTPGAAQDPVVSFNLQSASFSSMSMIPVRATCVGADRSPDLIWDGPATAQSFVLTVEDPDAPTGVFVHWVLFDIPGRQRTLPEGEATIGHAGMNDFGAARYGGPCPPHGDRPHRYFFTLSALNIPTLNLATGATRQQIDQATRNHVIGRAQLIGLFGRP